ncbi:S8 family serine peptidase [Agromyces archimandritae]|uniref:S8 family serine peptidase n=1 Tax=Agromyces archimandritae TaxID=2781962 RepID=A0A975IP71_9MICO|nr:S8 family serine peptidase [Agromyces archimandritae]QTX05347.1 S8 family serine peptidase [Agromyces archimandritae]
MHRSTTSARRTMRRGAAMLGAAAVTAAGLGFASLPAAAAEPGDKLGDHDRALIEQYIAQYGAQARSRSAAPETAVPDYVTLMLATEPGTAEAVAASIGELGATATRVEPDFGYVKANVPFGLVDAVVAIDDVLLADADELLLYEDTRPDGDQTATLGGGNGAGKGKGKGNGHGGKQDPAAGPSERTRDDNAYMPTNETGSVSFKQRNRTADGRGIVVGVMDSGVDPTHPALQTTTTGEPKLIDSVTGTSPLNFIDLLFDDTWHLQSTYASVTGPEFTDPVTGNQWTGPAESGLRATNEAQIIPGLGNVRVGVLSRDSDGTVWVDTDFDHDFTDETPLRPYAEDGSVGVFGVDDPATEISEAVPFTVQTMDMTATIRAVNLNVITVAHGTHVAGIIAGNSLFGGDMDGQAPGAQIVSMRACHQLGCSSAALNDGMIDLATDYGVDVVNMSIGGSPALNAGTSAQELIYNRVIAETGVQLIISAGNSGSGTNTHGAPSGAASVISVGASVSKDTYLADYGAEVKKRMDVFPFSSRGPLEDGGFKPEIVAPGAAISSTPAWIASSWVADAGYELPAGYSMMNGTSMAAPQATGAAALLLSAAEQRGIDLDPVTLRTAFMSTADRIDDVPVIAQGRGLIDVPAAWKLIEKGDAGVDVITASAPVCTVLSDRLATPNTGRGLFNGCAPDAGGQAAGESRDYTVTLTRTTGSERPVKVHLDVVGDDGTFRAPKHVDLPLGVPVEVKVTAKPRSAGVHSAELRIDAKNTKALEGSVMLSVTAADVLAAGGTWQASGSVDRNGVAVYTVAVPEGASALTVTMPELAADSQVRWWAFDPEGLSAEVPVQGTISCYQHYYDGYDCDPYTRTYEAPEAGVWEFVVEARRTTGTLRNAYELSATLQ